MELAHPFRKLDVTRTMRDEARRLALARRGPQIQLMSDLHDRRPLGRTRLEVSRLGLGGGTGLRSPDILYAYRRGVNLFLYSTDLHHFAYQRIASALRTLCGRRSSEREKVVLSLITYTRHPALLAAVLMDQFYDLRIDYIDLFLWGWITTGEESRARQLLGLSAELKGPGAPAAQVVEEWLGASERLRRCGAVRHLGMSFHDTKLAAKLAGHPELDVMMLRYNPAHRHAETRVLRRLRGKRGRPGVMVFNACHGDRGLLWEPEGLDLPDGCRVPMSSDCYRYALSNPAVDVCIAGPSNRSELKTALKAVQGGPLTRADLRYFERYGDVYRGKASRSTLMSAAPR